MTLREFYEKYDKSIILFLLLTVIIFSVYITDYLTAPANQAESVYIPYLGFFLSAIISTLVYTISREYLEKKLNDKSYTQHCFMIYNLKILAMTIVLFEIIGTLFLFIIGLKAEGVLVIFAWWIGAPVVGLIITLLFSFVPGVISAKYGEIPRRYNWIPIVIAILLAIWAVIAFTTCGLGNYSACIQGKAITTKDMSICESGSKDYSRDNCYFSYFREFPEERDCNKIKLDGGVKHACIQLIAIETDNLELCQQTVEYIDNCISSIATKRKDITLCEEIKLSSIKQNCEKLATVDIT